MELHPHDLETRCVVCRRFAYMCLYSGAETISGFVCIHCVDLMDGKFK